MPTVAEVYSAVKARTSASFSALPVVYKGEGEELPNKAEAFILIELIVDAGSEFVAFGGGRGKNVQRSTGAVLGHVLYPVGTGFSEGFEKGESLAQVFRGQRLNDVSYGAAQVLPSEGRSSNGNYENVATVFIPLTFDSLG